MAGVVEASTIIGLASGCIALVQATKKIYDAAKDVHGLHQAFREVAKRLSLVGKIIQQIETQYKDTTENKPALEVMKSCHASLQGLHDIFEKVLPGESAKWRDRYKGAIRTVKPGRGQTVERLMGDILKDLQLLETHHVLRLPDDEVPRAIEELSKIGPSMEDDALPLGVFADRGAVVPMGSGNTDVKIHNGTGDQWNNVGTVNFSKVISQQPPRNPTREDPCVRYPVDSTVSKNVYVERHKLMKELELGMRRSFGNESRAHGAAITGLGGTGKTQLALAYVTLHQKDFDTVLWFDAENEHTMRQSFLEHCLSLRLPLNENMSSDAPLTTNVNVMMVLEWLRGRSISQKWLVVVDNLDHITLPDNSRTEMVKVVPKGPGGSVIITSQDENVSTLALSDDAAKIKVDQMDTDEARKLLFSIVNLPGGELDELDTANQVLPEQLTPFVDQVVTRLDRLPFAVDLAGAAIKTDIDGNCDPVAAFEQWLKDFDEKTDLFLKSDKPPHIHRYDKTVWTVWNTTLDRIRNIEEEDKCLGLLKIMSFLDRTCIQTEAFSLASQGLVLLEGLLYLRPKLPKWAQNMFQTDRRGNWDDLDFREVTKSLQRYGLIRTVVRERKRIGFSMHSLVSWRAKQEGNPIENFECYLHCVGAALLKIEATGDRVSYKHLQVHMPSIEDINDLVSTLGEGKDDQVDVLLKLVGGIAQVWYMKKSWIEASKFYNTTVQICESTIGDTAPETIRYMGLLADCLCGQERWKEAEALYRKILLRRSAQPDQRDPGIATSLTDLARALLGQGEESNLKMAQDLETRVESCWRVSAETDERVSPETDQSYLEVCTLQRPIESKPPGGRGLMTLDCLIIAYLVQHPLNETDLAASKASGNLPFIQTPPHWRSITNRFALLRLMGPYEQAQKFQAQVQRLLKSMDPLPDMFLSLVIATPDDVNIFLRLFTDDQLVATRDSQQKHMLHWAAERGLHGAVDRCISLGVNVNVRDAWRSTPLHYASKEGHLHAVEALCEAGADLLALNKFNMTPFEAFKSAWDEGRAVSSDVGLYLATRQAALLILAATLSLSHRS